MSASKSTYSRQALVQALLKATPFTGPATIYLSLHTGAPGLTGANEVPSTNAYARTAIAFGAASAGAVASSALVTTPAPLPSNWGTITYVGLWDAPTGGNFLGSDVATSPIATSVGVPIDFPAGSVQWAET
jgi:hypothetical protein